MKMVLTAAYISLGAANAPGDVSGACSKVEVAVEVEDKDATVFTSGGWKESLGGLKSGTLSLTLKNDYALSGLDEDMWALLGQVVAFEVRASNAVASTSNPKYTGSVLVKSWSPVRGSVGDLAEVELQLPTSGPVVRATV